MSCLTNKQLHTFLILTQRRYISPTHSTFIMASWSHPGTRRRGTHHHEAAPSGINELLLPDRQSKSWRVSR